MVLEPEATSTGFASGQECVEPGDSGLTAVVSPLHLVASDPKQRRPSGDGDRGPHRPKITIHGGTNFEIDSTLIERQEATRGRFRLADRHRLRLVSPDTMGTLTQAITTGGYEGFYGLDVAPFALTPNTEFLFESTACSSALQLVLDSVTSGSTATVVTGDIGVGKSTLLLVVTQRLRYRMDVSTVRDPRMGLAELVDQLLKDFHSQPTDHLSKNGMVSARLDGLVAHLRSMAERGIGALLMVDDVQDLGPGVIEAVRRLMCPRDDAPPAVQLVLFGRRTLSAVLDRPDMRWLARLAEQRIELAVLSDHEVRSYIERRLWIALGGRHVCLRHSDSAADHPAALATNRFWHVRFTESAVRTISRLSAGTPLLINLFCDRALQIGHQRGSPLISAGFVVAAARQLQARVSPWLRLVGVPKTLKLAMLAFPLVAFVVWRTGTVAVESIAPAAWSSALAPERAMPPPETARVTAPLEESDAFLVAVASFASGERASEVLARVLELGLPGFTRRLEDGAYQVVVGPYLSRNEAMDAQRRLALSDTASEVLGGPDEKAR